jgi:high-affinity nickel permease
MTTAAATLSSVSRLRSLTPEVLGLLAGHFRLCGLFWDAVRRLNNNFGVLVYCIIAVFALSWVVCHICRSGTGGRVGVGFNL